VLLFSLILLTFLSISVHFYDILKNFYDSAFVQQRKMDGLNTNTIHPRKIPLGLLT
jgi:hypothetical protein